jgi:N-acetylneuraminic acid mutarotase
MTSEALTRSLAGSAVAIGLSVNVATAGSGWPDLPIGVKNGISAHIGDTIYVGLGRVDGFDQDKAESKGDEGTVVLVRLLAA